MLEYPNTAKNTPQFKPHHHLIAKKRGRFEFEDQPTIIDY
jgi:hypothetical protein